MSLRVSLRSLAVLASLACTTPAGAQDIYVDLESAAPAPTTPSAAFGGAAVRPGSWNAFVVPVNGGASLALFDTAGQPTGASLAVQPLLDCLACGDPVSGVGGDEGLLMDDTVRETFCGQAYVISGLQPGAYRVITYAWGAGTRMGVLVPEATSFQGVTHAPGPYPGLIQGRTFTVHHVAALTAGQSISISVSVFPGCDGSVGGMVQGLQFVRSPGITFCAGDGLDPTSTTDCPCMNTGAVLHGCGSSANPSGAFLDAFGTATFDDVVLQATEMPLSTTCVFLQGDAFEDAPFGDGVRCAGGNLVRLRARTSSGGAASFPDGSDAVTLSQRGGVTPGGGATRYYQAHYRNAATFCTVDTFNASNAIRIVW